MPLNQTFNLEYPLRFFTRSIFFSRLFLDFFRDFFPDFFLDLFLDNFFNFFPTFSSTFFTTFFSTFFPNFFPNFFPTLFPEFFLISLPAFFPTFCGGWLTPIQLLLWTWRILRIDIVVKTRNFSLQGDAKMISTSAVLLILTFALKTSTCDGVRLANYFPTLQEYPLNVMT